MKKVRFELHIKGWKEKGAPAVPALYPVLPLAAREEEFRGLSRGSEFVDCKTCAQDSVFYHLRPYLKPSVVDTPRPHSSLVEPGSEPRWDPDVLLHPGKGV